MPEFLDQVQRLDLLGPGPHPTARLGGWLKMGMVGNDTGGRTGAARRRRRRGLVNPLQGEGIAQAMRSGNAAATAILATSGRPGHAATRYRAWMADEHLPYQAIAAALQAAMLAHPTAIPGVGRLLTLPVLGPTLTGAAPGRARTTATLATRVGVAATSRTRTYQWMKHTFQQARSFQI